MNKLKSKVTNFKQGLNSFFSFENTINNLAKFLKRFYIYSVGFDDMYYGFRNPRTLKIVIIICVMLWIVTGYHLLLVTSDHVYGLIDGQFVPDLYRIDLAFNLIILFMVCVIKTDQIIGEIKYNTKPLEVFHFLMCNIRSKHKLTLKNYKRLAISSFINKIFLLNAGAPIISGLVIAFY